MKSPSMGNIYLLGADSDTWENFDPGEMVCLKPNKTNSLIARHCTNSLVKWYHRLVGHRFRVQPSHLRNSFAHTNMRAIIEARHIRHTP